MGSEPFNRLTCNIQEQEMHESSIFEVILPFRKDKLIHLQTVMKRQCDYQ